jgi:hypothetical protein
MTRVITIGLLLLAPVPAFALDEPTLHGLFLLNVLHAADWKTTQAIVHAGGREHNPFMRGSDGRRAAMKITIGTAQSATLLWLAQHPRATWAARITAWTVAGVQGAIVWHNLRQLQ